MERLSRPEGEPIEAGMVTRSIETAQRKVEGRNFDIRSSCSNTTTGPTTSARCCICSATRCWKPLPSGRPSRACCAMPPWPKCSVGFIPEESVEEQWDVAGLERRWRAIGTSSCR